MKEVNCVLVLKWRECCDLVNGTWTVYQTDYKLTKHPVQPVKKIKLRNWLIFTVCHVLERFRNFSSYGQFPSNVKTRGSVSFFLMTVYIYYFLVAMLRYCWRKATKYRVSLNKRPRSYHVTQAPQFSLSSLFWLIDIQGKSVSITTLFTTFWPSTNAKSIQVDSLITGPLD